MRRLYLLAGLAIFGAAGLVGWATLGTAQTVAAPPVELPAVDKPLIEVIPDAGPKSSTAEKPGSSLPGFATQRDTRPTAKATTPPRTTPVPRTPTPIDVTFPTSKPTGETVRLSASDIKESGGVLIPIPKDEPLKIEIPNAPGKPTGSPIPDRLGAPSKPGSLEIPDLKDVKDTASKGGSIDVKPINAGFPVPDRKPVTTPMPMGEKTSPVTVVSPLDNTSNRISHEAAISGTKQEPSVSLEWIGTPSVKVGMPHDYTLLVKNTSNTPVQKVIVQVRVPQPVNIVSVEPKGEGTDGVMMWELGSMLAKQERRIQMKLMSQSRGDINCQAWVTFTGSSVMRMMVREPKLLVKVTAPKDVLVGDLANIVMTVSNPGDHPAERVKITANLGEGLESVRGNKMTYDLGTLSAGETRTVQFPCVTKSAGEQRCDATVEADGGLKAGDTTAVMVIQPRLDLEVVGPKRRYLDRKAVFSFKITNPGNAAANNVFLTDIIPQGMKFVQADNGGQYDYATRSIKWFIGEVGPGQSKEVKAEFVATATGEQVHKIMAHATRGIKAEQEAKTVVEGLSAIAMEVVATENPIEVGADTTYEIKVTNAGTGAESEVKLVCTLPTQVKMKAASGPVPYEVVGNEIVFRPLVRLAPRADAIFKVTVTATAKGDARFKASLTTATLVDPVIQIEPTKIYED